MKFTCEKNALVSAVSVASRTVAQKSTIPALEGIYIRAGVKLTLSGYNLETGITISVDAEIQQTGACIMPSRLFFDIIRKLPDDTVSISVDEKFKVSIRGGISSFTITAMSSEDYPELPEVESDKGISLPQNELKAMIGGTSFAVFFRHIHRHGERNPNQVIIYLTDGDGEFPKRPPEQELLWVVTPGGKRSQHFPFGEVLRLANQAHD